MRMWVQALALLSGLRIRHCRELWHRSHFRLRSGSGVGQQLQLQFNPSLGTSICPRCSHIKTEGKKKKKNPYISPWCLGPKSYFILAFRSALCPQSTQDQLDCLCFWCPRCLLGFLLSYSSIPVSIRNRWHFQVTESPSPLQKYKFSFPPYDTFFASISQTSFFASIPN